MGDAATGFTFVFFPHDRLPWLGCSFPETCQCSGTLRSTDLAPLQALPGTIASGQRSGQQRESGNLEKLPALLDLCGRQLRKCHDSNSPAGCQAVRPASLITSYSDGQDRPCLCTLLILLNLQEEDLALGKSDLRRAAATGTLINYRDSALVMRAFHFLWQCEHIVDVKFDASLCHTLACF